MKSLLGSSYIKVLHGSILLKAYLAQIILKAYLAQVILKAYLAQYYWNIPSELCSATLSPKNINKHKIVKINIIKAEMSLFNNIK